MGSVPTDMSVPRANGTLARPTGGVAPTEAALTIARSPTRPNIKVHNDHFRFISSPLCRPSRTRLLRDHFLARAVGSQGFGPDIRHLLAARRRCGVRAALARRLLHERADPCLFGGR